jgi:ABC-type amino acid transport system permease subunit
MLNLYIKSFYNVKISKTLKITNDLKGLAIFIGAVIGIIAGIMELIVAVIIGIAALNGGAVRFTGNLSIFPDALGFIVAIFLLQVVLSGIAILYGGKLKGGKGDRKHDSIILMVIGIILLIIHAGFYIGPILIILGAIAYYVKEGDISINIG